MASPVSPSFQSMQHDKTYYIHGGDLVVLVENLLFRVHRYFFTRESVYFQTLFEAPHAENEGPAPGSSDSSAIMLDTTAAQFSRFLWVFYNPKLSLYDEATLDDWKSILELSHRWLFPEVKQLAIRELQKQPLSPVQRIELYHKNFVDRNFLIGDYLALCRRPDPLTLREGLNLGLETTLMIARTREEIRSPRSPEGVMTPLTPTLQGPELIDLIGKMFVTSEDDTSNNGDVVNGSTTMHAQAAATRPAIIINGNPEPKGGEQPTPTTAVVRESNGHSNSNPGGSPAKLKTNNQTASKAKNLPTGKKENQRGERKGANPKKGAANNKNQRNKGEEEERTETPVTGQQASPGGEANGDANGNNEENENDTSNGGEVKPVDTDVGQKAEGVDAQGVEASGTGDQPASNGDLEQTNGDEAKDEDKTTDP